MRELALEVLGEVPDQFVDYMTMVAQTPDQLYNPEPEEPGKMLHSEEEAQEPLDGNKIDERPEEEIDSPHLRQMKTGLGKVVA